MLQPDAASKALTLTGLYNVLEALRQEWQLTAKEKAIHDTGLVGVLKSLHGELDAAVLDAYGWSDLKGRDASDMVLERLVELNQRRAAEEKLGHIRWLRPEFQNPAYAAQKGMEQQSAPSPRRRADLALAPEVPADTKASQGTPWPATLPEQVRAVAAVVAAASAALTLTEIEARFKGRGPWKRSLPRILETLEALGRARREDVGGKVLWRG